MAKKQAASKSKPAPVARKKSAGKAKRAAGQAPPRPVKKKSAQKATAKKPAAAAAKNKKTPPAKSKPAASSPAQHKPATKRAARRKESNVKPAQPQAATARKQSQPAPGKSTKQADKKRPRATNPTAAVDPAVEGYLATLNDWRKDVVASLRKMIQRTEPKAAERVKRSQPVYEHHGPFAWIKAHAKHVNLGFWRGVELPDPRKLLEGTGNKMRHIKLSSLKEAGKKELEELVRVAAKLNEIKGNPTRPAKKKAKHK